MNTDNTQTAARERTQGLACLGAAVAVFVVCSIVQAAGDSSMFTMSYAEPDSAVLDLLMNVTWWPGWLLTAGLAFAGLKGLFASAD